MPKNKLNFPRLSSGKLFNREWPLKHWFFFSLTFHKCFIKEFCLLELTAENLITNDLLHCPHHPLSACAWINVKVS